MWLRFWLARTVRLALAALSVALTVSACFGGSDLSGGRGYVTGEGVVDQIAPADRVTLPVVKGGTLDGGSFDSRKYLGKVLVVNLWGSWCAPCRAEAPALRRLSDETRTKGVQFVGIDVRDNDAAARAFERTYKISYPSITTRDAGPALLAFGSILPRNAVPSTLVVDSEGLVAARVVGQSTYITLRDLVQTAMSEPSAAAPSRVPSS